MHSHLHLTSPMATTPQYSYYPQPLQSFSYPPGPHNHFPEPHYHQPPIPSPPLKLIKFSGHDPNFWLLNTELYFLHHPWPLETRFDFILLYLEGFALTWFQLWRHQLDSWEKFREVFKLQFIQFRSEHIAASRGTRLGNTTVVVPPRKGEKVSHDGGEELSGREIEERTPSPCAKSAETVIETTTVIQPPIQTIQVLKSTEDRASVTTAVDEHKDASIARYAEDLHESESKVAVPCHLSPQYLDSHVTTLQFPVGNMSNLNSNSINYLPDPVPNDTHNVFDKMHERKYGENVVEDSIDNMFLQLYQSSILVQRSFSSHAIAPQFSTAIPDLLGMIIKLFDPGISTAISMINFGELFNCATIHHHQVILSSTIQYATPQTTVTPVSMYLQETQGIVTKLNKESATCSSDTIPKPTHHLFEKMDESQFIQKCEASLSKLDVYPKVFEKMHETETIQNCIATHFEKLLENFLAHSLLESKIMHLMILKSEIALPELQGIVTTLFDPGITCLAQLHMFVYVLTHVSGHIPKCGTSDNVLSWLILPDQATTWLINQHLFATLRHSTPGLHYNNPVLCPFIIIYELLHGVELTRATGHEISFQTWTCCRQEGLNPLLLTPYFSAYSSCQHLTNGHRLMSPISPDQCIHMFPDLPPYPHYVFQFDIRPERIFTEQQVKIEKLILDFFMPKTSKLDLMVPAFIFETALPDSQDRFIQTYDPEITVDYTAEVLKSYATLSHVCPLSGHHKLEKMLELKCAANYIGSIFKPLDFKLFRSIQDASYLHDLQGLFSWPFDPGILDLEHCPGRDTGLRKLLKEIGFSHSKGAQDDTLTKFVRSLLEPLKSLHKSHSCVGSGDSSNALGSRELTWGRIGVSIYVVLSRYFQYATAQGVLHHIFNEFKPLHSMIQQVNIFSCTLLFFTTWASYIGIHVLLFTVWARLLILVCGKQIIGSFKSHILGWSPMVFTIHAVAECHHVLVMVLDDFTNVIHSGTLSAWQQFAIISLKQATLVQLQFNTSQEKAPVFRGTRHYESLTLESSLLCLSEGTMLQSSTLAQVKLAPATIFHLLKPWPFIPLMVANSILLVTCKGAAHVPFDPGIIHSPFNCPPTTHIDHFASLYVVAPKPIKWVQHESIYHVARHQGIKFFQSLLASVLLNVTDCSLLTWILIIAWLAHLCLILGQITWIHFSNSSLRTRMLFKGMVMVEGPIHFY